MKANVNFCNMSINFWGYVRLLSEQLKYSAYRQDSLKIYTLSDARKCLESLSININNKTLESAVEYMNFRANTLNNTVKHLFMNVDEAKAEFEKLFKIYEENNFLCKLPMNKQKDDKSGYAYFTGIINILAEQSLRESCSSLNLTYGNDIHFDDDPSKLSYILDNDNNLIYTLSRRFDGAFPSTNNPKAIWEIKEYYYTKTFGSRVADGVYETLLDGHEINELERAINEITNNKKSIKHFYFIDDKFTWWTKGKSYLCRIIDMLHMGFVDEVIFGKEVFDVWPDLIKSLI